MIVLLFAPGPFGGAEKVVLEGARALNLEIWIILETRNPEPSLEFAQKCKENNISTLIIKCRKSIDYAAAKRIRFLSNALGIKLIHSHGMKANFLASLSKVPFVATQHGKTSKSLKLRIMEYIEDISLKRAKKTICVSKEQFLSEKYKNAVLIENFLIPTARITSLVKGEKVKLLFLGRLSKEKAADVLINALRGIDNVELTIAGTGDQEETLKNLAHLNQNIKFIGFRKDVDSLLLGHDALVIPSIREGLPMAVLEAAAVGLPVIGSNVGGILNVTREPKLLAVPGDEQDLANKINHFINNEFLYKEKAKLRALKVRKKYSLHNWQNKTIEVYTSLS